MQKLDSQVVLQSMVLHLCY